MSFKELNDAELEQINGGWSFSWDGMSGYCGTNDHNIDTYPYAFTDKAKTVGRATELKLAGKTDEEVCQILKAEGLIWDRW